ncbi:UNVERIFIED_CONTAM: hypothetical protein K2H54_062537 [Gekko kuhli]
MSPTEYTKQTRAAARKRELRALYAQLVQLQESDEEEGTQLEMGGETTMGQQVPGKSPTARWATPMGHIRGHVQYDPREMEKIKRMQINKNFDNWLSAYAVYTGVVLQAYPDWGALLIKYLDLIHRAYKEYAGAWWLRYDELFRSQAVLDLSLPWDQEHQQLWFRCLGSMGVVMGRAHGSPVADGSWARVGQQAMGSTLSRLLGFQCGEELQEAMQVLECLQHLQRLALSIIM